MPEEVKRQHRKEYMELTKERRAQYWRLYYLRNADKIKEQHEQHNADHPEARRKAQAAYREKNKNKLVEYQRRYNEKHREKINEKNRERYWRKKNEAKTEKGA